MTLTEEERAVIRKMGSKGGRALQAKLSPEERTAVGRRAANARWSAVRAARRAAKLAEARA